MFLESAKIVATGMRIPRVILARIVPITKESEVGLMKISQTVVNVHQLNVEEFQALETAYNIINEITETYCDKCVLVSPNDGECVMVDELPRVKGILSFLMENRVVDVDVKR